jgi:hypothetical protein
LEENIPPEVSVFIDKDPSALENTYYYRVAGILSDPCNASGGSEKAGTGPYTHSLSNLDDNNIRFPASVTEVSDMFRIYPNPASELLTLELGSSGSGEYMLTITDLSGKILRNEKIFLEGTQTLDISGLGSGYYQLLLSGEKIHRSSLIVK